MHWFDSGNTRRVALLFLAGAIMCLTARAAELTPLRTGWEIQSSCKVQAGGAEISTAAFRPEGWIKTSVPSTVLAAQLAAGLVKDPDYDMNLRQVPGTTYNIGQNFSGVAMSPDSPYHCSWWYRKSFTVPAAAHGKTLWLHFDGMNYRANLWINGQKVADSTDFVGAFTTFTFDVTKYLTPGHVNTVAVETFAPGPDDLAMTWVDWSPMPPDKEMGLWGGVELTATGPVMIESPAVTTHFPDASLKLAELTVYANLRNATDQPVQGVLTATLEGLKLQKLVNLAPNETRSISFTPESDAGLKVKNPKLWWPWQMGAQNLETLYLSFATGGHVSDEASTRYGIREITSEKIDRSTQGANIVPAKPEAPMPPPPPPPPPRPATANGTARPAAPRTPRPPEPPQETFLLFRVNGKPILVRGGGWSPDMMLRNDPVKLREQFRMVREMGLNAIRSEGKMETEDFFRLADEQGVLVMIGWSCCDHWERWTAGRGGRGGTGWSEENFHVAQTSLESQILRLRSHPSVLVWLNGSDNAPTAQVESMYLKEEAELHWPNPTISSATRRRTTVSGESGVKMEGPYDYVAPAYWLTDTKHGGAWGFSTEIGPGPAPPTIDGLKKFLPETDIWPHGDDWSFHAGGGGFKTTTVFDDAMDHIYGTPTSAVEYDQMAQAMTYDAERAMFEGYSRNKYNSTGVIQWMLNNSWPSVIWHLYDYYLDTGGGYFGTKKACEPLHIQYSYDDHSIWVVNSTYGAASTVTATARVYDVQLKKLYENSAVINSTADSALKAIAIPDSVFAPNAPLYFVLLELKDKAGTVVSRNFYWLPATASTYDWEKTRYTTSPILSYENMTALRTLPAAKLSASVHVAGGKAVLHLHNPSTALAFQVAVSTNAADGLTDAPVLWSDNYVALMPGESMTLTAELPAHAKASPEFHITSWNAPELTLHAETAAAR